MAQCLCIHCVWVRLKFGTEFRQKKDYQGRQEEEERGSKKGMTRIVFAFVTIKVPHRYLTNS